MATNNTTASTSTPSNPVDMAVFIPQPILLIIGISGNLLVISAIISDRRLRSSLNYLVLNLSVCNIGAVVFTIPFQLIIELNNGDFIFGDWGCKILYPCSTWSFNVSVSFLLTITIDRYIVIVHPFAWRSIRHHTPKIIIANHLYGVAVVLPYAFNIEMRYNDKGLRYCAEKWSPSVAQFYTVFLVLVQYAIPFLTMAVLYTLAWLHLKRHNDWTIRMSEAQRTARSASLRPSINTADSGSGDSNRSSNGSADNSEYTSALLKSDGVSRPRNQSIVSTYSDEAKMMCLNFWCPLISCPPLWIQRRCCGGRHQQHQESLTTDDELVTNETENKTRVIRTSSGSSQKQDGDLFVDRRKRRQTIRTFFMFLLIIAIFGVFALPSQLIWLLNTSGSAIELPAALSFIVNIMHYVNYVINPFIYGGLNRYFLRAYKRLFLCSFSSRDSSVWSRGSMGGSSYYGGGGGGGGSYRQNGSPHLYSVSAGNHSLCTMDF